MGSQGAYRRVTAEMLLAPHLAFLRELRGWNLSSLANSNESELFCPPRQRILCGLHDAEVLMGGWALENQRKLYLVPCKVS